MTKSLRRKRQSKEAIECSEDQQPPIKLAKDEANTASVIADRIDHDKGLPTDPGLSTLSQADSVDHVHVNVAVDVCITECNSKAQVNHVTLGQSHRDSGVDGVHDNDTKLETTIVTTTNEDITDGQNMNMSENSSSQILKTCESIYMKPSNQILNSTDNTTEININKEQKQHSNDVFEHDQKHEDIPKLLPCNKNNKDFDVGDCKGIVIVNAHSLDNLGNLHEDCPLKDSSQKGNVVVENHQENSLDSCEKDSLQIEHSTGNDDKVACKSVGYDKDKVVCPTIKTDAMITSNIASQRLNRITESQESSLVLDNDSITNEKTKSNDSIAEVTSTPTTVGRPGSSSSGGLEWDLKGSPLPNMTYNPISADLKPMMVTVNDQLKFPSHSSSSVSSYLTDMEVNGTQPFCATVTAETKGVVGCAVQTPDPIFKSPKLASKVKTAIKEAAVLPVLGARHHNHGDLAASHHHHPVDDFDITDSELRSIGDAISEMAVRLPQSVPRPSSSVHDPEHVSEGSRIIKTIITEMAQLNKFVMRARRQIEATRKSRQRPPSTTLANTTVQTTSTGWKKF